MNAEKVKFRSFHWQSQRRKLRDVNSKHPLELYNKKNIAQVVFALFENLHTIRPRTPKPSYFREYLLVHNITKEVGKMPAKFPQYSSHPCHLCIDAL